MSKKQKRFWELSRERDILEELRKSGNLRELHTVSSRGSIITHNGKRYVNLSSNDYLGLSDSILQAEFFAALPMGEFLMSNPSSRLMTGNSEHYEQLESLLAQLYQQESALVLGSGFLLNSGILPAVTTEKDVVIADKLMHASLIDGMRLSQAKYERYRHNDMNHLEVLLRKHRGERVIVATESLFSMDGDRAPLEEIAALQSIYDFELYLDEAHALGVWGRGGLGYSVDLPQLRVDYFVATFGKAICSQGAFVVCSKERRELLVNKMRTLIFSTALPPISLLWTRFIMERLADFESRREHLQSLIEVIGGESQIVPHIIGDSAQALLIADDLKESGFWVSAIRPPTVPPNTARLRFSLTAAHTHQQISELCRLLG